MNDTSNNSPLADALTDSPKNELLDTARQQRWGLALVLIGWLHLFAFLACYYLTIVRDYHEAPAYLTIWVSEFVGMLLIFWLCAQERTPGANSMPLEKFIRRVWLAYFILAFNLGSMNTLRGHAMFELFPAMATLASFAFIMMAIVVDRRFFVAMLIMFASGLLMAAYFWHAFLIFAVAWWVILNGTGLAIMRALRPSGEST